MSASAKELWIVAHRVPSSDSPLLASGMLSLLRAFEEIRLPIRWFSPTTPSARSFPREELKAHTDGFSNRTLWPLCHQVHQSPTYIKSEWEAYDGINRRMADVIVQQHRTTSGSSPVLLVQDYHFARLPLHLRNLGLRSRISFFWHVPWPSLEQFQTLPWAREILESLGCCEAVGFHTQADVNRYHSAQRTLMGSQGRTNGWVIPAGPPSPDTVPRQSPPRTELRSNWILAVGIDRLDYTKGLLQKFQAIDLLLERRAELRGRFQLLQIACPTRERIPEYQNYAAQVRRLRERINQKWGAIGGPGKPPILLLEKILSPTQMEYLHRRADLALVTPLQDGMNLVAKEHALYHEPTPARAGALILSRFAGAADELQEAYLVHPFSPDSIAEGMERALDSPQTDRHLRMLRLKARVGRNLATDWARNLLKRTLECPKWAPSWYPAERATGKTELPGKTAGPLHPHHRLRPLPSLAEPLPESGRTKTQVLPK